MGKGVFCKARENKGQSTIEYIILVTAIIAVMILFLAKGGPFQKAVNQTLESSKNSMLEMSNRLKNSRPAVGTSVVDPKK
ncbi:MAG: class III signal peptide-containing protein [Candidatus Omnitrophica bacterium]|nr:class III signal peptide-containing protein [Candidatus Omnitrophota bacterium]